MTTQHPHPPRPPARQHRTCPKHSVPACWAGLAAAAAVVVLSACTSSSSPQSEPGAEPGRPEAEPGAQPAGSSPQRPPDDTPEPESPSAEQDPALTSSYDVYAWIEAVEAKKKRERLLRESSGDDRDVDAVEPDCDQETVTVSVCFVAFGDATLDGSGPDQAIAGARIVLLRTPQRYDERREWWESVYSGSDGDFSIHDLTPGRRISDELLPGRTMRSTPESVSEPEVLSVVTGADGIATVATMRTSYEFCAVHPDDDGLIAGCTDFVTQYLRSWIVYVYFSHGRAFFGVAGGRYARFEAGETHPAGTGKVTFTSEHNREYFGTLREMRILLDQDNFRHYVIVEDADIGEFWEAVYAGWRPGEVSQLSRPADEPATLVRTGPDGTAIRELPAGDYLFCAVWLHDGGVGFDACTYEDVTAGQDRMIYGSRDEAFGFLDELNEQRSAQILEELATCNPSGEPYWCATEGQWQQARQHYKETGQPPDGWPDP